MSYSAAMLRRLARGAALVAAASMALAGCTPPEPTETTPAATSMRTPEPSASPEAVLLERAVVVARTFLSLADEAFASGTVPVDGLATVAGQELIDQLQVEVAEFAEQGFKVSGASQLDTASIVQIDRPPPPSGQFVVLACVDTSGVVTVDSNGQRVTGNVTRQPRVFAFDYRPGTMVITATTPPSDNQELAGCGS